MGAISGRHFMNLSHKRPLGVNNFLGRYFYLFATQLHYLKMPKEKKKNVGRDGEEA